MSDEIELTGSFPNEEGCANGLEALHGAKITPLRVYAPVPSERIAEAMHRPRSWVRLFVLLGGISGIITGFAITIGTSWEWNLVVGGKPVVSFPPFIIIAFELMILFGGISALIGFLFIGRLPVFDSFGGYSGRFAGDRFGVVVRCRENDQAQVESLLRGAGADEILREEAA